MALRPPLPGTYQQCYPQSHEHLLLISAFLLRDSTLARPLARSRHAGLARGAL